LLGVLQACCRRVAGVLQACCGWRLCTSSRHTDTLSREHRRLCCLSLPLSMLPVSAASLCLCLATRAEAYGILRYLLYLLYLLHASELLLCLLYLLY
jgi:hypothetical protein